MSGIKYNPFRGKRRTTYDYYTEVVAAKVFDHDILEEVRVGLLLQKMKKGFGAKEYVMNFGNYGAAQIFQYYLEGKYTFMDYLPDAGISTLSVTTDNVKGIITSIEDEIVEVIDTVYETPTIEAWIKFQLQELHDYNIGADSYSVPVYDELTGTSIVAYTIYKYDSYSYSTITNKYTATLSTSDGTKHVSFELPVFTFTAKYIVTYNKPSEDRIKLWIYDASVGTYPSLLNVINSSFSFEVYPIVLLRNDYFSLREYNINSKEVRSGNYTETVYRPDTITKKRYDNSKEMLSNSLDVDLDDLTKNIESNPDIDSVQDAFILLGLSPHNTDPIVSKALYMSFDYLYSNLPPMNATSEDNFNDNNRYFASFVENPYNQYINWYPRLKETKDEIIGEIGTYTHSIYVPTPTYIYDEWGKPTSDPIYPSAITSTVYKVEWKSDKRYGATALYKTNSVGAITEYYPITYETEYEWMPDTEGGGSNVARVVPYIVIHGNKRALEDLRHPWGGDNRKYEVTVTVVIKGPIKKLTIKHQISATQTQTIVVTHLKAEQTIARGKYTGTVELDVDDQDFVFPLPVYIADSMSYIDRVSLMCASVHLIFYAAEKYKIVGYRGTAFSTSLSAIVTAILMIITVISAGTQSGWTVPAMMAILAASVTNMIIMIAISIALQIVLHLIANIVKDTNIKMIASAVVMVAAMVAGGMSGGSGFTMDFTTVVQLADIGMKVIEIYTGDIIGDITSKTASVQEQMTSYSEKYATVNEEYDKILKSLDVGLDASFMVELTTENDYFSKYGNKPYSPSIFSPSLLRTTMIDGYRMFDALYQNPMDTFFENVYQVGIIDV